MSLNNLGNRLSDLGRREEALAATGEALDAASVLADLPRSDTLSEALRALVVSRIEERIEGYRQYKDHVRSTVHAFKLPGPLHRDNLPAIEQEVRGRAWAQLDAGFTVVGCNDAWAGLFEVSKTELIGRHLVEELTPRDLRDRLRDQLEQKAADKKPRLFAARYLVRPGDPESAWVGVLVSAYAVVDDAGESIGSFGVVARFPAGNHASTPYRATQPRFGYHAIDATDPDSPRARLSPPGADASGARANRGRRHRER